MASCMKFESSNFATSFRGISRLGSALSLCDDSNLHIFYQANGTHIGDGV